MSCSVYVISHAKNTPPTKIGVSLEIKSRFGAIQSSNPAQLFLVDSFLTESMRVAEAIEKAFKVEMKKFKIRGEWFDICPIEAVKKLKEIQQRLLKSGNTKIDDHRRLGGHERKVLEFISLDLKAREYMPTMKEISQATSITQLQCRKAISSLALKGYIQVVRDDVGKLNALRIYPNLCY